MIKPFQRTQRSFFPKLSRSSSALRFAFIIGLWLWGLHPSCALCQSGGNEENLTVKNLWPTDIEFENQSPTLILDSAFTDLWIEAFNHEETELRQELIASMEQVHRAGFDQSMHVETIHGLINDDNHHTLNIAIASLLVALDDEPSANLLFDMIRPNQIEISQIVEPALAKWNYAPAIELWRKRLKNDYVRRTHLLLAMDGLGVVGDKESSKKLLEMATNPSEKPSIRLSAARSVGAIGGNDIVGRCIVLANSEVPNSTLNKLCCVAMLANQDSQDTVSLLQELMCDESGAVAGAAWQRIVEIDSENALPFIEQGANNKDPIVRRSVVTTCFEQPNVERVDRLGNMLADRHPDVRVAARAALRRLARGSKQFDAQVRAVGVGAINGTSSQFRGIEQGVILLTELDHKQAAQRVAKLLSHKNPNVYLTSAWSLRRFNVKGTLESMLQWATQMKFETGPPGRGPEPPQGPEHDQIAHLFDAFGEANYGAAKPLVRKFVLRGSAGTNRRKSNSYSAAITAAGKLYGDEPDAQLVSRLVAVLDNVRDGCPNDRAMAAMAIGRMKATSQLDVLRKYYKGGPPVDGISYAAAWAIRKLTGEPFPPRKSKSPRAVDFNLTPIGSRPTTSTEENSKSNN